MSTKILEQEWAAATEPYGAGTRVVVRSGGLTICYFPAFDPASAARRSDMARFVSAAPDMARALMALRARTEEAATSLPGDIGADTLVNRDVAVVVPASVLRDVFDALRKAGVL
jgi:hypothetical protein